MYLKILYLKYKNITWNYFNLIKVRFLKLFNYLNNHFFLYNNIYKLRILSNNKILVNLKFLFNKKKYIKNIYVSSNT